MCYCLLARLFLAFFYIYVLPFFTNPKEPKGKKNRVQTNKKQFNKINTSAVTKTTRHKCVIKSWQWGHCKQQRFSNWQQKCFTKQMVLWSPKREGHLVGAPGESPGPRERTLPHAPLVMARTPGSPLKTVTDINALS